MAAPFLFMPGQHFAGLRFEEESFAMPQILVALVAITLVVLFVRYLRELSERESKEELEAEGVLKKRSFDAFRRAFPEFVRNGAVTCPKCNGRYQFFRSTCYYGLRCHACKTCGTRLYYTEA